MRILTRADYEVRLVPETTHQYQVVFTPVGRVIHIGFLDLVGVRHQINYDMGERMSQPWWYRAIGQLDEKDEWILQH